MENEIDYKAKYEQLSKMVIDMLDTQQLYFKTKDYQVLSSSKAKEKKVREFVTPKKTEQTNLFEFLAR